MAPITVNENQVRGCLIAGKIVGLADSDFSEREQDMLRAELGYQRLIEQFYRTTDSGGESENNSRENQMDALESRYGEVVDAVLDEIKDINEVDALTGLLSEVKEKVGNELSEDEKPDLDAYLRRWNLYNIWVGLWVAITDGGILGCRKISGKERELLERIITEGGGGPDLKVLEERIITTHKRLQANEYELSPVGEVAFKHFGGSSATAEADHLLGGVYRIKDCSSGREHLYESIDALVKAGWALD